jgi:hypothetical protein
MLLSHVNTATVSVRDVEFLDWLRVLSASHAVKVV